MINTDCLKCGSNKVEYLFSYIKDIETLENGNIVIYYYCFNCKTEYEIIYRPEDKFITAEN